MYLPFHIEADPRLECVNSFAAGRTWMTISIIFERTYS